MTQIGSHRRAVGLIALTALILVLAIVVSRAPASRDSDSSTNGSARSDEVAAPWRDSKGLHFGGEVYERPTGRSYAATQDSALVEVLPDDPIVLDADADNPVELETLLEVPIDGKVVELTDRLLGVVIADSRGPLATWAQPARQRGGVRLIAYDTATHQVLRTLNIADRSARPFAVDGRRIFVAGQGFSKMWDLGSAANQLVPVPNLPGEYLVTDAHDGKLIYGLDGQTHLIDADGDEIKTFDVEWLTFSPDGSHIAGLVANEWNMRAFVWDVADAAEVPLQLPKNADVLDLQWETDGDLLIPTVAVDEGHDWIENASAAYNTCSTATGKCKQVSDTGWIEPSQVGHSSGLSQLNQAFGS